MTYACANIKEIDISGCGRVKISLIVVAITELEYLETFRAKRSPKINNDILTTLGTHCKKLKCIDIGGCPNDYND